MSSERFTPECKEEGSIRKRVFYALDSGGHGVGLTNLLGKHLARTSLGEPSEMGPMSQALSVRSRSIACGSRP